jgi:PglZ domain
MTTLQQHISRLVHTVLDRYPGSWMVWCDPRGDWGPLLQRVAELDGKQGFTLVPVAEQTAGEIGSPAIRRALQERIDAKESFVLHVTAPADNLGWLWAQALLSECIYDRSLREQLLAWGWHPQSIRTGDNEVAVLARQYLKQDPAEWGGGGLQPNPTLLLDILAAGATPDSDDRMILDLTIEQAGLPAYDEQNVTRWRIYALVWLLVTQAYHVAPDVVGEKHTYLIAPEKRTFALNLLERWLDSLRLSKGLHDAILEADRIAALGNDMSRATIKHGPFLSHAAERAIFANTCASLAQLSRRELLEALASLHDDLQRHTQGFWNYKDSHSHVQSIPWGELARLSAAVEMLLDASPLKEWANPSQAIAWYTKDGWRVDKAGEELLRNLNKPVPELLTLITPLRQAYRARWEDYMIHWSELWTSAGCPVPDLQSAGAWIAGLLKLSKRATAMIVVDAMRYDLGMTLASQLNKREGAERAAASAARTALPTITALGMGMALPLPEKELQAEVVDGKWQLRQAGYPANLSIAEQRREWLRTQGKVAPDALLTMADVQQGTVPSPHAKRSRLVVFDDLIDKLGHDEELEAMGSDQVMQRYLTAIEHLRDKGWLRVLVVTDHGFIHWPGSEERNVPPPVAGPVYSSRRALAYPEHVKLSGPQGLAPGRKWRIAVPSGAASFRAYGGLGYFHGGASLQEWIIPCIKIEWPQKASPVNVKIQPIEQILSLRPKIILEIERDGMFIEDTIPRQVEVKLLDAQRKTVLFHSEPKTITPDHEQIVIVLQPTDDENAQAERGTPLTIEVRDWRTKEVIATEHTILMVPLENW